MDEEEQFNQAFGEHTGISKEGRENIENIKNNATDIILFLLSSDTDRFTNLSRELLGRYIANNTHLKRFDLDDSSLTDEKMVKLFSELTGSMSLERLDLDENTFGIEGVRSIVPFLQNCPKFSILYLCVNDRINSECFEVLVSALDGKSVQELYFYGCDITDISALETYNLPHLKQLNLDGNKIGREGCIILSNLLQNEGSTLTQLILNSTGIENDEAKLIAASLKQNTMLEELYLTGNNLTNEAYVAFLKLLVDMSSIDSVYSSNHTLTALNLSGYDNNDNNDEAQTLIDKVCKENRLSSNPEAAGRSKVIKYQLKKMCELQYEKICELQDIKYTPGSIFVDIEPVLLPRILALIGSEHGQSELYTALIQMAPDLLSYIDRKAMLDAAMAKITSRATSLSEEYKQKVAEYETKMASLKTQFLSETSRLDAEKNDLNNRRALIDVGDSIQSATGEGEGCGVISRGKKRGRS